MLKVSTVKALRSMSKKIEIKGPPPRRDSPLFNHAVCVRGLISG